MSGNFNLDLILKGKRELEMEKKERIKKEELKMLFVGTIQKPVQTMDDVVKMVNKKFPDMVNYHYVKAELLTRGMCVIYIDHDLEKLSAVSFVVDTKKIVMTNPKRKITKLVRLYSERGRGKDKEGITWNIDATKNYFFESLGNKSGLKGWADAFMAEHVNKYLGR